MKHLTLDDIKINKPDFDNIKMTKSQIIYNWLIDWVKHSLEYGIADIGDYIPSKEDLALFLGVSTTTIQNAIRQVKNQGYFTSKQSSGTCIADFYSKDIEKLEQYNSVVEYKIKRLVIDFNIPLETPLPSVQELSKILEISTNTIRLTLSNLAIEGYLEKKCTKGNKHIWIYKKEFKLTKKELLENIKDEDFTLKHQLIKKIEDYIKKTCKQGDKILPTLSFSRLFNASPKTINDVMKILASKGIILPRRGRYGTIYLGEQKNNKRNYITTDNKNFKTKYEYCWQKALEHLKNHIIKNYKTGDKIKPIRELSLILNVSPNTIRRALKSLVENGNLVTKTGKKGGIFIVDMPQTNDTYKWLALNPEVIERS